jgi:hypothetical protein
MVIPIWSCFWKIAPATKQTRPSARHEKRPRPASYLPRLESLEDRHVLSAGTLNLSPIPSHLHYIPPAVVSVTAALPRTPNQGQTPDNALGKPVSADRYFPLMAEPTKITDLLGQSDYQSRLDSFTSPEERSQATAILLPLPESSLAMVGTLLTGPANKLSFTNAGVADGQAGSPAEETAAGPTPGPDAARIGYQIGVAGALEKNLSRLRDSLLDGPPPFDLSQTLTEVDLRPALAKSSLPRVSEDVPSRAGPAQPLVEDASGPAEALFWTGPDPEVSPAPWPTAEPVEPLPAGPGERTDTVPLTDATLPPVFLSQQENTTSWRTFTILLSGVSAVGWSLSIAAQEEAGVQASSSRPPRLEDRQR